jgi:hypothetical protein
VDLFGSLACSYDDSEILDFISCWGLLNSWYLLAAEEGFLNFLKI